METLDQLPFQVDIEAVVRDGFPTSIDMDFDMTGYTVVAYVDTKSGAQVAFTVTETDLSAGQFDIDLTAAQMTSIGIGEHRWYVTWTPSGGLTRTGYAGKFTVFKYMPGLG